MSNVTPPGGPQGEPGQPAGPGPYPGQPGQPGPQPGQPGPQPGQPGPYPGHGGPQGPYPGQPGPYPGQPGPYPGQPGPYPGQPGLQPGQPGAYPGQAAPTQPFPQVPPVPRPGAYPPAGGYPGAQGPTGTGPYGQGPKKGNNKVIALVAAGVAVAVLLGGLIMFFANRATERPGPTLPTTQPTQGPRTGPTTSVPRTSGPTTAGRPATTPAGAAPVAEGVSATLPEGWQVASTAKRGIVVRHSSGLVMVIQAASGEKSEAGALCQRVLEGLSKSLGNAKSTPCKAAEPLDRVQTSVGQVSGTLSTSQGSVILTNLLGVGVRDDGLASVTQILFPSAKPPSDQVLKEAVAIYGTVLQSQNSAP